jgi:outer membrane lipoprotein-sorting protein
MNRAPWESDLERSYQVFDERHAELREQLMVKLADVALAPANDSPPRKRSRSLVRSGLALAASISILAVAWLSVPWGAPKRVFSMDDLVERLQKVRSIHIRGMNFFPRHPDKPGSALATPVESYAERPNRYRTSTADNPAEGVRQRHTISDGKRHAVIDDLAKTFIVGSEAPLAAEYTVEDMVQNSLIQQLLGGPTAAGFKKIRSEVLAGATLDVYEREFQYPERPHRSRIVVWFDPATGLPRQVQQLGRFQEEPERLISVYDQIVVNGEAPAGLFDFSPPLGYKVEHRDVPPDAVGSVMSGSVGQVDTGKQAFHALRFCFNIDNRAALVCWARFNDLAQPRERDLEGPVGRRLDLTPTSSLGDRSYGNYFLRVDPGKEFHWRWSLVVPEGDAPTLGDGQLVFSIIEEDGVLARGTMFGSPLRFDRARLARWIVEAQRLTLPADAGADAVFTLERIEALIDQVRQGAQSERKEADTEG